MRMLLRYRLYVAIAFIILVVSGLSFYLFSRSDNGTSDVPETFEKHSENVRKGFGFISIEKIQKAHPKGERLKELMASELRLRLELDEMMHPIRYSELSVPEIKEEIFDEAAWQKNAQAVIAQLAELQNKKKAAAKKYRDETETKYISRRNAINDKFLNENLNIQLKLQNADNLRLKATQISELREKLEKLEFKRNDEQKKLLEEWLAEIEQHSKDSITQEEINLRAKYKKLKQEVEEQTSQKKLEVIERNKKLTEEINTKLKERQKKRRELFETLKETEKERVKLEKEILTSIIDKAAFLASVYRLEIIFMKRELTSKDRNLFLNFEENFKSPEKIGAEIFIGKDVKDLTNELIKEMSRT